jgi:hypothetical protein
MHVCVGSNTHNPDTLYIAHVCVFLLFTRRFYSFSYSSSADLKDIEIMDDDESATARLDHAVMREILNRSLSALSPHLQRHGASEKSNSPDYAEDMFWERNFTGGTYEKERGIFERDKLWQEIKAHKSHAMDNPIKYVPLYDKTLKTLYHFDFPSSEELTTANDETGSQASNPNDLISENATIQTTVETIIGRLVPYNEQSSNLIHSGYPEWMKKAFQKQPRDSFAKEAQIWHYGNICTSCLHVLTHSCLFYAKSFTNKSPHSIPIPDASSSPKRIYLNVPWSDQMGVKAEVFRHHKTIRTLYTSAANGCHLCSLLVGTCSDISAPLQESQLPYLIRASKSDVQEKINLAVQTPQMSVSLVAIRNPNGFLKSSPTLRHHRTDSLEVLQTASTWLKECIESHGATCADRRGFLPSRLIKLNDSYQSSVSARLVLHADLPIDCQYLTLSHCWGGLDFLTLDSTNLNEFLRNIPICDLTNTFQQAIQLTHWLGYKYIWIDSLCIVQDSQNDWEDISASMGRVYSHSTCTIAATGAENGNEGLFFNRYPLSFMELPLLVEGFSRAVSAYRYKEWPSPLDKRAWVLQEQILSPRTIRFGTDRIYWTCRCLSMTEGDDPEDLYLEHCALVRSLDSKSFDENDFPIGHDPLLAMVRAYSKRNLTFQKDKWPAFRGIAQEFAILNNVTLICGLRYPEMCAADLVWLVHDPNIGTINLRDPSWSWLNSKGKIQSFQLLRPRRHIACHIVMSSITPERICTTDMETLLPSVGNQNILEIRGYITTALPELIDGPKSLRPWKSNESHYYGITLYSTESHLQGFRGDQSYSIRGEWWPDDLTRSVRHAKAVYLFNEIRRGYDSRTGRQLRDVVGLVIVPAENMLGYWRRAGMFRIWDADMIGGALDRPWPWAEEEERVLIV